MNAAHGGAAPRAGQSPSAAGNVRSVVAALAIAGALLVALQFVASRRQFIADVRTQAHVVGLNSAAAVMFADVTAGTETLQALRPLPDLQAAALFDARGRRLGDYRRPGEAPVASLPTVPYAANAGAFTVVDPVVWDGRIVGHVVLRTGFLRLYRGLLVFAGLFVLAGAGALAVSYPLVRRMRREVRIAEARLDWLAHFDPVTGQLNRHAFNAQLQRLGERMDRDPRSRVALAILDVDDFKVVNDSLGHHVGDELLKQVAERLQATLGADEAVFRIGGDEFALLLVPDDGAEAVRARAEGIVDVFRRPFVVGPHEVHASASCGIASCPGDAAVPHGLPGMADAAMYRAKHGGKNSFELFRSEMNEEMQRRHRIQGDLRGALDRDELALHYQAQAEPDTMRLVATEALIRWRHPSLGWVPASEIVSVAEECGLIVPLGRWVVRQAARQQQRWREQGFDGLRMAINVSPRQARDDGFVDYVAMVMQRSGGDPALLELEITESLLFDDTDRNLRFVQRLRDRGFKLAIDDFGTGYSSLAYLHRLPLSQLKIDMGFVRAIPGDGEPITVAILAMAHSLGLTVVAEGVETARQLEFLRDAGCDLVQGYLVSKPLPADEMTRLLADRQRVAPAGPPAALPAATGPLQRSSTLAASPESTASADCARPTSQPCA